MQKYWRKRASLHSNIGIKSQPEHWFKAEKSKEQSNKESMDKDM